MVARVIKKSILLISVCGICMEQSLCSRPAKQNSQKPSIPLKVNSNSVVDQKDAPVTFILPITTTSSFRIYFSITIPEGFTRINDKIHPVMNEFIPKTDTDPFAWSEIITTELLRGSFFEATKETEAIIKVIRSNDPTAKIVDRASTKYGDYTESSVLISYINGKRREVVYAHHFSGPCDCSGFQYAISLQGTMTLEQAQKKIEAFVKNRVRVDKSKLPLTYDSVSSLPLSFGSRKF